jgi:hypothetical protein
LWERNISSPQLLKAEVFELDSSSRPDGHGRTLAVPQNLPMFHLPFFGTSAPAFLASDNAIARAYLGFWTAGPFFEPLCSVARSHSPITFAILPAPFFIGETFLSLLVLKARVLLVPIGPWRQFPGKVPAPRGARLERQRRQHRRVPGPKGHRRVMVDVAMVCARSFERPLSFRDPADGELT